jgi:cytochrome oxidase Cu insertion factor (SCO1/SenC/PrrC family)
MLGEAYFWQHRVRGAMRQALQVALLALAMAAPAALAHGEQAAPQRLSSPPAFSGAPFLGVIRQAPDFTLLDRRGQPVRLSELQGRTVLLSFIFTQCASACPLLTHRIQLLQARLSQAGLFPARVALLSVTVDPERDSADALDQYAQRFDARPGWYFLRDQPQRLQPMLAAYNEWTKKLPDGDFDHPARVYLIDPAGRIREIYSLAFFDERQALLDIQAIEREKRTLPQH